jgi:fermentation-respiration switch protein FrsA (DUF1100 family)
MGIASSVPKIFLPPSPASYGLSRDICMLNSIDSHSIASKMFTPFSVRCEDKTEYPTLLFSHGNADDIGTCGAYCQWLADSLCCNVVVYDYVNYGVSDRGQTSEHNMIHGIEAVYGYLTASLNIPPHNIFVLGKSLGSVPSVYLSSQSYASEIGGVILVSPIASGARVVMRSSRLPARLMELADAYFGPNIQRIGQVRRPVLLVHGTLDDIVAVQNSHDLFNELSPGCDYPPLWVQAGHNDIECLHKGLFVQTLQSFMHHCRETKPVAYE